jgi:hypothetical protein
MQGGTEEMSRWIAMHCGEEIDALQENYPNAFLLICQIARRARWKECAITGLSEGEAWIGDWKSAGLHSRKAYEVAKKRLEKCGLVHFEGRNKGTTARLIDSRIFSLTAESRGEQKELPEGIQGEPSGNQGGTIHTENKEIRITQKETPRPPSPAPDPFERIPESNKPQFEEITRKIQAVKPEWKSALDYEESRDLLANAACLQSQEDSDWQALKDWLYAKLPEGDPTKKPGKRCWFIKSPAGYFEAALQWKRKQGTRTPPRSPEPPPRQPEPTAEDKAALAQFLNIRPQSITTGKP